MAFQLTLVLLSVVVLSLANVNLGNRVARDGMPGSYQPADQNGDLYKSAFQAVLADLNLGSNCSPTVTSATQQVVSGNNFIITVDIPSGCSTNAGKTCIVKVYIPLGAQPKVTSNSCSN